MSDRETLQYIIDEIDVLINNKVTSSDPKFAAWKVKIERYLINKYGENSYEIKEFNKLHFCLVAMTFETSHNDYVEACRADLLTAKEILSIYLNDTETHYETESSNTMSDFGKVFIVHGHDEALKQKVARIIERQGIEVIILNEKPNKGKTIIEKIESYSDVNAAICLFTPDDICSDGTKRPRQNVVFEAGYFMGKIGREKVICIANDEFEILSDLQGVIYVNTNNWEIDILKELRAIGYNVDLNKLL